MFALFLFTFGAIVGSFLNVCIWRVPRGESVMEPPSHCPKCDTRLRPFDLVPIVSQIALRARCRYCGSKIAWRYAGIEALTGVLFVLAGINSEGFAGAWWNGTFSGEWTHWIQLAQWLLAISCLVVIFWVDYETLLIPMTPALLLGLAGVGAETLRVLVLGQSVVPAQIFATDILPSPLPQSLVAMIATASVLWLFRAGASSAFRQEAMGFGDIFLTAGIAANLGWSSALVTFLFLSVTVGALAGLAMKIPRGIKAWLWARRSQTSTRKEIAPRLFWHALRKPVPFGPMLAVGAFIAMIYGARINRAYLHWANPEVYARSQIMQQTNVNHASDHLDESQTKTKVVALSGAKTVSKTGVWV